jgi:hypothetical protein
MTKNLMLKGISVEATDEAATGWRKGYDPVFGAVRCRVIRTSWKTGCRRRFSRAASVNDTV